MRCCGKKSQQIPVLDTRRHLYAMLRLTGRNGPLNSPEQMSNKKVIDKLWGNQAI